MADETKPQNSSEHSPASRIVVSRRGADRLRAGHLWVYQSDLQAPSTGASEPAGGELVTVVDGRGAVLGTALYSAGSQIVLRMISERGDVSRAEYLAEVRRRVSAAIALRSELAPLSAGSDARRLIFSEADDLPGIVADQYGDLIVAQLLVQGTSRPDVREVLGEALAEAFGENEGTVWERTDARIREMEGLESGPEEPLWSAGERRTETSFHLNGLQFHYDVAAGQKTGAFLDQRLNYSVAERHAHGRGLDVCTYQGGFAMHLARACERVTGVDASRVALEVADRNLEANRGLLRASVDWIEADAFALLRAYQGAGERFDTIVLDPPAFAKTKRATVGALRGYKELNLTALRICSAGGTLVTCSCSHHVPLEEFLLILRSAAEDAHRRVQVLEIRGAAPDHPALLTMPETSYLKCVVCRVA